MARLTQTKRPKTKAPRERLRLRKRANADRALAACTAERVRFARTKAGLSQAELAERAGLARPNVARLEAGRHLPSLSTLRRVADALGVTLALLVTLPGGDPEDHELAEAGLGRWRDRLDRHDKKR